jgi:hypothetical protein
MSTPDLSGEKPGETNSDARQENGLEKIVRRALHHRLHPWLRDLLVIDEVWTDVEIADLNADIVLRHQIVHPPRGSLARIFHTLVIDLTASEKTLWNGFKKDVRNMIRRAEREGVHVAFDRQNDRATMDSLENAYAKLQARKSIYPFNRKRLLTLAERGRLSLSTSESKDGEILSWHTYYVAGECARGLYFVTNLSQDDSSDRKSLIGRANRLHHWQDMLHFRARGCKLYDLGGWYTGSADRALLQINRFKEGFGGNVVTSYDAMIPLTLKGRMAILAWRAAMVFLSGWFERKQ